MDRLTFQHSAAGLFTKRTESWQQHVFQVQFLGSSSWVTLETEVLSPMGAFGWRQRLDRILFESRRGSAADPVRQRMVLWIARRCAEVFPTHPPVTGVRLAQTLWRANTPELARPAGHWVRAPLEGLPGKQVRLLASYRLVNGVALRETNAGLAGRGPASIQQAQEGRITTPKQVMPMGTASARRPAYPSQLDQVAQNPNARPLPGGIVPPTVNKEASLRAIINPSAPVPAVRLTSDGKAGVTLKPGTRFPMVPGVANLPLGGDTKLTSKDGPTKPVPMPTSQTPVNDKPAAKP